VDSLDRPIFVVAPPQSGSVYLHTALGLSPSARKLDAEQRWALEAVEELRPAVRGHDSNRRTADDATPEAISRIREGLAGSLRADDDELIEDPPPRVVDATPRHALRVPFLDAVFPDASFVYVYREPRDTLASMVEAWRSQAYVTYPRLPGWPGPPWSLLLVEDWRELEGRPLAEIVAAQWESTTRTLLADLEALDPSRWAVSDFAALASEPAVEVARICSYLGLVPPEDLAPAGGAPSYVLAPGSHAREDDLERLQGVLPQLTGLAERARDLIARPISPRPRATPDFDSPLSSVYTAGFARVLDRLGGSLLISAPRAGRLVCVRHDGVRVNTHFRRLGRPTGIATSNGRITVAAARAVWDWRLASEVPRDEIADPAVESLFVVRNRHYTGDVDAQELAAGDGGPWLVLSRFDALATLDHEHSFVIRWQPASAGDGEAEGRVRLTGLATDGRRPAYVTAGAQDGSVIAVDDGGVVASGLSMPNSPRLYEGRLLFLESGEGALVAVADDGELERVAELPGFARGLAIAGRTAFVGVSHPPNEDLPVAERVDEPACGLWALDVETGNVIGHLQFSGEIDEIFEVAVLGGHRYPELARPDADVARSTYSIARAPLA
jgi:uncharacterized protein (TIGR03032 family)